MFCNRSMFETLEGRRFLSVTASALSGLLKKGTVSAYETTSSGKVSGSIKKTVVGAATVHGVSTIRVDTRQVIGTAVIVDSQYVGLNPASGLLLYQTVNDTTLAGFETRTTDTFTPTQTVFPKTLAAGKTYTFKWTDLAVSDVTPSSAHSMSTSAVTRTVKLTSAKLSKVKVPVGTFNCYIIQTVTTLKTGGATSKTTQTQYIAPNVGVVKTTQTQTSAGSPARTSTTQLTKFVKGKG